MISHGGKATIHTDKRSFPTVGKSRKTIITVRVNMPENRDVYVKTLLKTRYQLLKISDQFLAISFKKTSAISFKKEEEQADRDGQPALLFITL